MQNESTYHGTHAKKLVEAVSGMQKGFRQLELYCYEGINIRDKWHKIGKETHCNKIYNDFLEHYYTLSWQAKVEVKSRKGKKYLKTENDESDDNNLLSLPECSSCS